MTGLGRPNPPFPGKISHFSAELFWKIPKSKDVRISVILQESTGTTNEYETIYTGFGKKTDVTDLVHETTYKFRLKLVQGSEASEWSPLTELTTKSKPATGDDLHRAVTNRSTSTVKQLLANEDIEINAPDKMGNSPLMNGCVKGFDDVIEVLLQHKANPHYSNSAGKNSLMLACYHGNTNCIDVLLKHGADWCIKDHAGASAFHYAIDGGNAGVIKKILSLGRDVDDPDDRSGWSPLMRLVTINGNVLIARMLIDNGADVNFEDNTGKMVLMAACLNGNKAMVELLVNNGADLWSENEFGKTAYDMAKAFERRAVTKYIEEMEAIYPRPPSSKVKSHLNNDNIPGSAPSSPATKNKNLKIQRPARGLAANKSEIF